MNLTHNYETRGVRICQECARLGLETVSFELDRYPQIAIAEFQCRLGHLQFEALSTPQRPDQAAA